MITMPPPSPVSEPRKPAPKEPAKINAVNSRILIKIPARELLAS